MWMLDNDLGAQPEIIRPLNIMEDFCGFCNFAKLCKVLRVIS